MYLEELKEIYDDAKQKLERFIEVQASSDKMICDIEHCIEFGNCDAVTISKLTRKLKVVLRDRREAKNNIPKLQSIVDKLKFVSNLSDKSKRYTIRTDVLSDIIGKSAGEKIWEE